MTKQLQPQHEFFLYVSTSQQVNGIEKGECHRTGFDQVLHKDASWIKIPLAESLVVYARQWKEQEANGR